MNKESKSTKSPEWVKTATLVLMGVIVGIVLSYAMVTSGLKKATNELNTEANTEKSVSGNETVDTTTSDNNADEDEESVITTYTEQHEEVTGTELKNFQADLEKRINYVREKNSFVQVQTGVQDYETYVYNKNNECVAETSDGSYSVVFRNDNKVVKYEDSSGALAVGTDIEIMTFIKNAANAAGKNDNAKLYYYPTHSSDDTYKEYRVDLVGDDAVRLCYSPLGEDFADIMMEHLKSQDTEWNPHLVIVFYIPTNGDPNFGAVALSVYDNLNKEFTNWDVLGWIELEDWQLEDWWYTYDFSKTDTETYVEHMKTLMDNIHELLDKAGVTDQKDATGVVEQEQGESVQGEEVDTNTEEVTDNSNNSTSTAE